MEGVRNRINSEIEHFDLLEEDRALSLEERVTREEALGKLWDLERTAEIF